MEKLLKKIINIISKIFKPNNVTFTSDTKISCLDKLVIGDNCLFGRYVCISDSTHGKSDYSNLCIPPIDRELSTKGSAIIVKNIWIGRFSTILSGVTIRNNSIICMNLIENNPSKAVLDVGPFDIIKVVE